MGDSPMLMAAANDLSRPLALTARMVFAAGEGAKKPTFEMVAYTGGVMNVAWWGPVVIDLAGIEIPDSIRVLADHEARMSSIVGVGEAAVVDGSLHVEGRVTEATGVGTLVIALAKDQVPLQASVGIRPTRTEEIKEGGKAEVNGQTFKAGRDGLTVVKTCVLQEVSVVVFGADANTSVSVAAQFKKEGQTMTFAQWLAQHKIDAAKLTDEQKARLQAAFDANEEPPDLDAKAEKPKAPVSAPVPARSDVEVAIGAERERVAGIQELCAGEFPDIEREAIRAGRAVEDVSQAVLKAMRERRPQAGAVHPRAARTVEQEQRVLEAALCIRAGLNEESLVKEYSEPVVTAARRDRDMAIPELFVECAKLEGKAVPRAFGNDTIRAAFSTVSLPGILNHVANKRLLRAYQAQQIVATLLCSSGDLSDFKESERYRMTDVGDLEPVAPDGELKSGGLKEEKATNQLGTYGKMFALTRQMIFNDDLGAFLRIPEAMGARAARKVDQLFFTRLLSNPGAMFSEAHGNYADGAETALDADALAAAVQMFLDQTDADGQPINIGAKFLLVPTALKMTAKELINSTFVIATGATDRSRLPTYNALADEGLVPVASPYLSNANYAGHSALAWYLFGDPAVCDTFEVGYLKGNRVPTIERGDTDFNTLGIQFRVYFDVGVREQDYRGIVKMKGEAA